MKFSTKLVAALWSGMCFVYAIHALDRQRRQSETYDQDRVRNHEVMGAGLGAAVAEVWDKEGKERALTMLARANERENRILVRWVEPGALVGDVAHAAAPSTVLTAAWRGEVVSWMEEEDEGYAYTYVPVRVNEALVGAIEVSQSLEARREYLRDALVDRAETFLLAALASGVVAFSIGAVYVGRPIRKLVEKARQVGAGDFDTPLYLRQRDELGELADEMNAMSRRLSEARTAIESEMAARLAALEQLRHGERLMTVGKLASGIAHELGTPLTVISQRASMIATAEVEGEAARENAIVVAQQADRITRIIRQLLDFARRRTPETSPAEVLGLVERTLTLLRPLARTRGVELLVGGGQSSLRARVDPVQMQQVLTNLALNGIQAMAGGGRLVVSVNRAHVVPPADVGGEARGWVSIAVRDEGHGIAPEDLPRVFDPFFTTKPVGEGTGLGLSVAYGIVREHDGWIAVQSQPGQGATFTVYLPEVSQ